MYLNELKHLQDWFRRNFVFILLIIINASLAFLFIHMLIGVVPSLEEENQAATSVVVTEVSVPSESATSRITKLGQKLIKKVSRKLKGKK